VILLLTAYVAAHGIVASLCYWQGRMIARHLSVGVPRAWTTEAAPLHAVVFAFAVGWTVFWLLHALRLRRLRFNLTHAAAPMIVFWYGSWQAWRFTYACNIF
jgi:hypothetical protein